MTVTAKIGEVGILHFLCRVTGGLPLCGTGEERDVVGGRLWSTVCGSALETSIRGNQILYYFELVLI
jgi:hypothetical protein